MLSIFLLPLAYILLHLLDHQYSTVDVHSFVHFDSNRLGNGVYNLHVVVSSVTEKLLTCMVN